VVTVTKKIRNPSGKEIGTAVIVVSLAPENRAFLESRRSILELCVLLGFGTATVLVLFMHLSVVRPILRLVAASRRLQAGETEVVVDVSSNDEVGVLARAFNDMSTAVRDRETKLDNARGAVEELLDNMRQGIVVFDRRGVLVGTQSRAASELFARESFEGVSVAALLFGDGTDWQAERQAFDAWLELAGQLDEGAWDDIAALAPHEATIVGESGPRTLDLDFRPLGNGRVMLLATDVTDKRKLLATRDQKAREVVGLRRALGGAHLFATFLEGAKTRVARCRALASQPLAGDGRREIARNIHTLKGEAHVYELGDVVGCARQIEDRLASEAAAAILGEAIDRLGASLDAAEARFVELAGADALARVPVNRADLARLLRLSRGKDDEASRLVQHMAARPFGEIIRIVSERVPEWAISNGKQARLVVEGDDTLVPGPLVETLSGAIVHLVRNAIAHGIEDGARRASLDKDARGTIWVHCQKGQDGAPHVTISDDGAGIAEADAARVFEPGFSTQGTESELAGRGVGLYAVREELALVDYDVGLGKADGGGARFELRPRAEARISA
jgi:two-component system chemotaxis sensor kinase CheA